MRTSIACWEEVTTGKGAGVPQSGFWTGPFVVPALLGSGQTVLERLGFDAVHAADGEAALALLEYYHPNLILLDILMPKLDGIEVFRRIQAMPHLDHVPVVIITAHERFRNQLDLSAKDSFLVKPVRPHQLAQVAEGLVTVP